MSESGVFPLFLLFQIHFLNYLCGPCIYWLFIFFLKQIVLLFIGLFILLE